jgi:protein-tyrosine phosphatase
LIDLHAHVLPGIDDGPTDVEGAIELLEEAAAHGVKGFAATPHVSERYPTTADAMERGIARLTAHIEARSLPLRLLAGGEIAWDSVARIRPAELRRFSLGGRGRFLLVELPWDAAPDTAATLRVLRELALRPVIAHPERYAYIQAAPASLDSLIEAGALAQVTISSLLGEHGRAAASTARSLLENGLVHLLASDVHGRGIRRAGLWEARAALADEPLVSWLTQDVPLAVVRGADLPPRPARRRRFFGIM